MSSMSELAKQLDVSQCELLKSTVVVPGMSWKLVICLLL